MSEVTMSTYVKLTLSQPEFTLLCKSLAGILHGSEKRAAAELNVKLSTQLAQHAAERAAVAQGAVGRAQEILAQTPEGEPTC